MVAQNNFPYDPHEEDSLWDVYIFRDALKIYRSAASAAVNRDFLVSIAYEEKLKIIAAIENVTEPAKEGLFGFYHGHQLSIDLLFRITRRLNSGKRFDPQKALEFFHKDVKNLLETFDYLRY